MTVGEFSSAINLAARLIAKKGEKSTLSRVTTGTLADPDKPWEETPVADQTFTVDAVWLDASLARTLFPESALQQGDQMVLIAAKGLTVTPNATTDHLVRVNGERWTLVEVGTLAPNEDTIMHTIQVRK